MSRIGKQYISIPDKVNIRLEGQKVFVDGPKGKLTRILPSFICCTIDEPEKKVFLEKAEENKLSPSTIWIISYALIKYGYRCIKRMA